MFLPLMHSHCAMNFCRTRGILNKDYKDLMMSNTAKLIGDAERYAKSHCGEGIIAIPTWHIRKEELAHDRPSSVKA